MAKKSIKQTISIIIPAFNEEHHIQRCLESIVLQEEGTTLIEVIVVDNGSSDCTASIANSFKDLLNITILSCSDSTVAAVRNWGVKASSGAIIAFLDADCSVLSDWISNALPYFDCQNNIAAVGCSYEVPEGFGWVATIWDMVVSKNRTTGEVKQLPAGNMIVDRGKFDSIGGFNERLITNEDFDLCYRLQDKGYKVLADDTVKAFHWGTPDTLHDFYRQTRWHGRHVYKVFFSNIKKMRNAKAVFYGIYFLVLQLSWIVALLLSWMSNSIFPIFFILLCTVAPPVFLAYTTVKSKTVIQVLQLSILYFVYGIARSHSFIDALRGK